MIILLMGVQGAGKTTVGRALAERLGWTFEDADPYHPPANIAKMSAGIALTDADRVPWLAALRGRILEARHKNENLVLACSALKASYRRVLMVANAVKLVYLRGDHNLISKRIEGRTGHYAKADLLHSQFGQLEEPRDAITVDINATVEEIVEEIVRKLGK